MEPLPEIDDHVQLVAVTADGAWRALLAVLAGTFRALPRPLASAWALDQPVRSSDWDHPVVGSTIPGFAVADLDPPTTLVLRGRHRFSRYELRFLLVPVDPGQTEVHARSSAVFPGVHGRLYRAVVIGTGAHRVAVRRLLAQVARRAERHR